MKAGNVFIVLTCFVSACAPLQESTTGKNPPQLSASAKSTSASWTLIYQEDFEQLRLPKVTWSPNELKEDSPYADDGAYFKAQNPNFKAPISYRASAPFGKEGWLQFEGYSRDPSQDLKALFTIEKDPANPENKVLRLHSPRHTNGSIVRSANPLPDEYRICMRAGFMDAGTGYLEPTPNGYRGDESAEPWINAPAINENGFYWLAILSDTPRPRNNVWIHHHRKVVIDSDNNTYPSGAWTHIWNGTKYLRSGEHPIMMFALDKNNASYVHNHDRTGQPFIAWAKGQWNSEAEVGEIRAVDAYREREWYRVCIEKTSEHYKLSMSGNFRYGGETSYEASIARDKVFDPKDSPDFFMFGDPHVNFYRGLAYFDDLELYIRK